MSIRTISCDRLGNLIRAAVWKGKELHDLYLDRSDAPDMTGALVRGKVTRVTEGQAKAWIHAGLEEKLYIEKAKNLKAGDQVVVQIMTTQEQGKAWPCKIVEGHEVQGALGVIQSPPLPWQRALEALPKLVTAHIEFDSSQDLKAFHLMGLKKHKAVLKKTGEVHPDLDEIIDALQNPVVPLKQIGHLVIQQTEALVSIDVNGNSKNPTDLNMRAVHEAVRQIRLRNLSGVIMIDCLSMPNRTDKQKIVQVYNKAAEGDRSQALGMTKAGLLEVTRSRRGPSIDHYYE